MNIPAHIGTVITAIRLQTSAITPVADHLFSINRKRTKNPALDMMVGGFLSILEGYVDEFHSDQGIIFKSEDFIAEQWNPDDPFVILILADSFSVSLCERVVTEFQSVLREFTSRVLEHGEGLSSTEAADSLTSAQIDFVSEFGCNFVSKYEERTISDPFICDLPGQERVQLPIQGRLTRSAHISEEFENTSFFAISEGAKGDDLMVYLREVGVDYKPLSSRATVVFAESCRFTKIASAAHAEDFPLVWVTVSKKRDEKGKLRTYLKEIKPVSVRDLPDYQLGCQLAV